MAITYRAGVTLATDAGTFTSFTSTITGSGVNKFNEIATADTITVFSLAVDVSAVKAFGLKSNRAVTVCINDDLGGSPTGTMILTANKPVVWVNGDTQYVTANPLGVVDVLTFHVSNDDPTLDATVEFAALVDVTPA